MLTYFTENTAPPCSSVAGHPHASRAQACNMWPKVYVRARQGGKAAVAGSSRARLSRAGVRARARTASAPRGGTRSSPSARVRERARRRSEVACETTPTTRPTGAPAQSERTSPSPSFSWTVASGRCSPCAPPGSVLRVWNLNGRAVYRHGETGETRRIQL